MGATTMRRRIMAAAAGISSLPAGRSVAQNTPTIRLGVLSDFSGPYCDWSGPTTLACVLQAVEEMRTLRPELRVEVIQADHQHKPDVGANLAREWFDRREVEAIVDVNNSAVGLAVHAMAREKNKVFLESGASTAALTAEQCSPNTVHWTYDTYMLAKSTSRAMVRAGGESRRGGLVRVGGPLRSRGFHRGHRLVRLRARCGIVLVARLQADGAQAGVGDAERDPRAVGVLAPGEAGVLARRRALGEQPVLEHGAGHRVPRGGGQRFRGGSEPLFVLAGLAEDQALGVG